MPDRLCSECSQPLGPNVPERGTHCSGCLRKVGVPRRCVDCGFEVMVAPTAAALLKVPEDRWRCKRCRTGEPEADGVEFECSSCRKFSRKPARWAAQLDWARPVLCVSCLDARKAEREEHVSEKCAADLTDAMRRAQAR